MAGTADRYNSSAHIIIVAPLPFTTTDRRVVRWPCINTINGVVHSYVLAPLAVYRLNHFKMHYYEIYFTFLENIVFFT